MAYLETDPLDLALGADGDLALDASGSPYLISGLDAVAQTCRIALLLVRGEWFLNLDDGVPWLENATVAADDAILGRPYDERAVLAALRDALLGAPGVSRVLELAATFDRPTRTLSVTWSVQTAFGDTPADTLAIGVSTFGAPS